MALSLDRFCCSLSTFHNSTYLYNLPNPKPFALTITYSTMRVPIPTAEGRKSTIAASYSENSTIQGRDHPDPRSNSSSHDTMTADPTELTDDSVQADASRSRCSSPETVVGDEGALILTPTSTLSNRSTTPVVEADRIDLNSRSREEAVEGVSSADLRGDEVLGGCSRSEAKSLGTSDRQGFERGNEGASHVVTLEDADEQSGATPSLKSQDDRTGSHLSPSTLVPATQIPFGTYEQVQINNSGGVTISRGSGAARSNGNAFPTSNLFSFTNPFASRPSNPGSPRTSSYSYNIFSSNPGASYTSSSSSSNDTFTNQTLSACNFTSGARVTNRRLTACTGRNLVVTNCSFTSCDFSKSTITNCKIRSSNLTNNRLTNCTLSDSNVVGGSRTNCS